MDLTNFNRVLEDRQKNYMIRRNMVSRRNIFKDWEQDRDVDRSEAFKTLREPLLEQQKKTDATQNRLIEKLEEGQAKMVEGIQDIVTLNRELPQLPEDDRQEGLRRPPPHARSHSESAATPKYNVLKGLTEEDKAVHAKYDLKPVKELIGMSQAQLEDEKKFYTSKRTNKHGKALGKLKKKKKDLAISPEEEATLAALEREGKILSDYLDRLNSLRKGEKFRIGTGLKRGGQQKRNAFKVNGDQFGQLMIDMPKLLNEMKIRASRNGKVVLEEDADQSLIDLLTKRFNPKKPMSMKAARIFNDLVMLSNLPKHPSSGKSKILGSSVMFYSKPEDLVKRMHVLVGSQLAGNNSPQIKNDLSMINDEFLKIGAIDRDKHRQFYEKYIK